MFWYFISSVFSGGVVTPPVVVNTPASRTVNFTQASRTLDL